jgi:RNA polymerase sigma-70 factor (ECF subfamily)
MPDGSSNGVSPSQQTDPTVMDSELTTISPEGSEDDSRMIRLQSGDRSAFAEIAAAWQRPLFCFFLRNTRCAETSEDLVQETMLRLFRNSWDYLPKGLFRGFLFRIARNLLTDHSRRLRHDVLLHALRGSVMAESELDLIQQLPDNLPAPTDTSEAHEFREVLNQLLQLLPEEQRLSFTLHYYDSLTLPEVADAMACTLPAVKGRLRLAREKLRQQLASRGYGYTADTDSVDIDPVSDN